MKRNFPAFTDVTFSEASNAQVSLKHLSCFIHICISLVQSMAFICVALYNIIISVSGIWDALIIEILYNSIFPHVDTLFLLLWNLPFSDAMIETWKVPHRYLCFFPHHLRLALFLRCFTEHDFPIHVPFTWVPMLIPSLIHSIASEETTISFQSFFLNWGAHKAGTMLLPW